MKKQQIEPERAKEIVEKSILEELGPDALKKIAGAMEIRRKIDELGLQPGCFNIEINNEGLYGNVSFSIPFKGKNHRPKLLHRVHRLRRRRLD